LQHETEKKKDSKLSFAMKEFLGQAPDEEPFSGITSEE
jgi:hypothetical protein